MAPVPGPGSGRSAAVLGQCSRSTTITMHSIQSFMVRILIRNGQDLMRHEKTDTTGFPSLDFPIMGGLRLKAQGSSSNSQFPHGCDPLTAKAAARAALLAGLGGLVLVFARAAARRLYHDLSHLPSVICQAGRPLQFLDCSRSKQHWTHGPNGRTESITDTHARLPGFKC